MIATDTQNIRSGSTPMLRPGSKTAAIGGKTRKQAVLKDDRNAEGDQEGRQKILADGRVQQETLQAVPNRRHERHDENGGEQGMKPGEVDRDHREIRCKHDQVAMGDVDEAHDAEDERQPGCKQRIKPAEHDTLEKGVDPVHRQVPK
jgi:hypothetical protein